MQPCLPRLSTVRKRSLEKENYLFIVTVTNKIRHQARASNSDDSTQLKHTKIWKLRCKRKKITAINYLNLQSNMDSFQFSQKY
jgi:hypothetical protein